jgi:uncharacterized ferritin-like protein (DUF455 family)
MDPESADEPHVALARDLVSAARNVVAAPDLEIKISLAKSTAKAWFGGRLPIGALSTAAPMPDRPGRPPTPILMLPRDMPRRSSGGEKGRFALLHALAHIELNAVDMTWDLIGRFAHEPMPRAFFDNWVQVGLEEAKHFDLLQRRLRELGGAYGDQPAHDGLWQAAQATGHDLLARLAVVPLVLEARGLDVTPGMIRSLEAAGDLASAKIIAIIYRDEKRHVAFGARWFRHMCEERRLPIEATFPRQTTIQRPCPRRSRIDAGLLQAADRVRRTALAAILCLSLETPLRAWH